MIKRYAMHSDGLHSEMMECGDGGYVEYSDHLAEISGLNAARMAYASEFPLGAEGEPDVGSIHKNIRKLKAEVQRLEAENARLNSFFCDVNNIPPYVLKRAIRHALEKAAQAASKCYVKDAFKFELGTEAAITIRSLSVAEIMEGLK